MKKLIAIMLVLMLALTVCAVAEEEAPSYAMPEQESHDVELKPEGTMMMSTADQVTVDGNTSTVVVSGLKIVCQNDPTMNALVFTQDMAASFESYFMLNDMDGWQTYMIENGIHLEMYFLGTGTDVMVFTNGNSTISEKVGDLSAVDDSMVELYAAKILQDWGADGMASDIVKTGSMTWVRVEGWYYISVVGGQYVSMKACSSNSEYTEDNMLDGEDAASCITITVA